MTSSGQNIATPAPLGNSTSGITSLIRPASLVQAIDNRIVHSRFRQTTYSGIQRVLDQIPVPWLINPSRSVP